jgi:ATP-dependent Clp protease ATP-binding subunit ClpA
VEKVVGPGPEQKVIGNIPYTPRVKKVLALAANEATALNHTYVGTEHILLGLLEEGDGVAARVLRNLDVDVDQTRKEILRELDPNFGGVAPSSSVEKITVHSPPKEQEIEYAPLAQGALALAREEAKRLHHSFIGTEHLMLGLINLQQGVAYIVLQKLGLVLKTVRGEIEAQIGNGPEQEGASHIPYTPRALKVLKLGTEEAKGLGHRYFDTEHILLGILREGEGVTAEILKKLDITLEQTRLEIQKELGHG